MEKIKQSKIAGAFYPNDKEELKNLINSFENSKFPIKYPEAFKSRAVIVPHAGLIYSGNLAYKTLKLLNPEIKTVFIFAPAHRVSFSGIAILDYDFFNTPFKNIEIEKNILNELKEKYSLQINNEAFELEHSIEVQLPLIQTLFENLKVVPLLVGAQSYDLISNIIENYYDNKDLGFIISSDLSHFLVDAEAKKLDSLTARMIETKNLNGFKFEQACGALSIAGLVDFAAKKGFSLIRVGLTNSAETSGDKSRVVGYGSWALYEKDKNEFLDEYYHDLILDIAKAAITDKNGAINREVPAVFDSFGASFVTLEKFDNLRGCIGSIIAHRPFINDLIINARNAAFSDPRFKPVESSEIPDIKIAVSILSEPAKMSFSDENDLLNQIVAGKDGIIIRDFDRQAVYLPSVWEQLPDKKEFLNSLKVKAGLNYNHFSNTFEAFRFYTTYVK